MYSIPGLPSSDGYHALINYTLVQTSGMFIPQFQTKRIFVQLMSGGWGGDGGSGVAGTIGGNTSFGSYVQIARAVNDLGQASPGYGNGGNGQLGDTLALQVRGTGNGAGSDGGGGNADGGGGAPGAGAKLGGGGGGGSDYGDVIGGRGGSAGIQSSIQEFTLTSYAVVIGAGGSGGAGTYAGGSSEQNGSGGSTGYGSGGGGGNGFVKVWEYS